MNIEYLGHSAFKITSSNGTSFVTDPYDPYVGFTMKNVNADFCTVSHHHKDHDFIEAVQTNVCVDAEVTDYVVNGITINSFDTAHDHHNGKKRGRNLIFKYEFDGLTVCHMGDIGEPCSPSLLDKIGSVDVLFIPVGGYFTVLPEEASEYVTQLNPKVVIPMHFKSDKNDWPLHYINDFLSFFDKKIISFENSNEITLNKNNLPDTTVIKVLNY